MDKKMLRNIIISGVSLLVLVGIILGIVFIPSCGENRKLGEIDEGVAMRTGITQEGLHYAEILTNDRGKIENNSYGTLIEKTVPETKKISMETQGGNYTFLLETPVNDKGETGATVYTLEGFEDYNLQGTNQALLASSVINVSFTKVADLEGKKSSKFGFDAPRAKATVYYNDDTYSILTLGDTAADGESCYIKFGESDTIYIAPFENFEPMLYDITDLFSTAINNDVTSVSDDNFSKITLGGSHLAQEVVMEKNTDEALSCFYVMSSHKNTPMSNDVGSRIVGTIKSLSAEEVICVNPNADNLKTYGLNTPYATVKTAYTYTENEYDDQGNLTGSEDKRLDVSLLASKPGKDGYVNLMEENGKIIYKISKDSVAWVDVTMETLRSEFVLSPSYSALSEVAMTTGNKTYNFVMGSEQIASEEDSTTETTVTLNGKKLSEPDFYTLIQDLSMLKIAGADKGTKTTGEMLKLTYNYSTGRSSDTVVFESTASQKVIAKVNGDLVGYVYKDQIDSLCQNIIKVTKGQEITTIL